MGLRWKWDPTVFSCSKIINVNPNAVVLPSVVMVDVYAQVLNNVK
jgi:hypothetical protein